MVSSVVLIIFVIPTSHSPGLTLIFPCPGSFPGPDTDELTALKGTPRVNLGSHSDCQRLLAAYCHKTLSEHSAILLQIWIIASDTLCMCPTSNQKKGRSCCCRNCYSLVWQRSTKIKNATLSGQVLPFLEFFLLHQHNILTSFKNFNCTWKIYTVTSKTKYYLGNFTLLRKKKLKFWIKILYQRCFTIYSF